jgi:hypothetical protein
MKQMHTPPAPPTDAPSAIRTDGKERKATAAREGTTIRLSPLGMPGTRQALLLVHRRELRLCPHCSELRLLDRWLRRRRASLVTPRPEGLMGLSRLSQAEPA